MKKIFYVLFIVLILTGCGKSSKVETVDCTLKDKFLYGKKHEQYKIEIKNNKFEKMTQIDEYILDDIYLKDIDVFMEKLTKELDEVVNVYGYEVDYKQTDTGAYVEMTMNAEQANQFFGYDTYVTKKMLEDGLTEQGFICK